MSRPIEQIAFETVLAATTAGSTPFFGDVFSVGVESVVCRLTTDTNDDTGVDDAFELYAVLAYVRDTRVPTAYYPVKEKDPIGGTSFGLFLGDNMTQAEIVISGTYVWKKILGTTPAVGVEVSTGYERK